MKKTIYSIILFMAIGMVAIAQDDKAAGAATDNSNDPNAPEITFESDIHDFGTLEFGGNGPCRGGFQEDLPACGFGNVLERLHQIPGGDVRIDGVLVLAPDELISGKRRQKRRQQQSQHCHGVESPRSPARIHSIYYTAFQQ